jgi:fructose PTS system EIIBC or EIIC component
MSSKFWNPSIPSTNMIKIVAVTACPTGIAHTYMAAEMLEKAAKKLNVKIIVETNGAIGVENRLKQKDIEESIAVIVAADARVDMQRFNGKPLIEVGVSQAIKNPTKLIQDALSNLYPIYKNEN